MKKKPNARQHQPPQLLTSGKIRNRLTIPNLRKISKTISEIENRSSKALLSLANAFSAESLKKTVCFTGAAGVGKSSLISRLAPSVAEKKRLAWIACDPSSPETGGSLLGDRIRLSGQAVSDNLFVRSMSTRGMRAFSRAIRDIEVYLEPYFSEVWVETAGSGQTQSDVARISGITILILQPETGDEIQWMKSGVRDWADLFLIHKADLPGASLMARSLSEQGIPNERIVMVSSKTGDGLSDALSTLERYRSQVDWKRRLSILHEAHAKDLCLENLEQELDERFSQRRAEWIKNPYSFGGRLNKLTSS